MNFRSDLALDRISIERIDFENGISNQIEEFQNLKITTTDVLSEYASSKIQKEIGRYITIDVLSFADWSVTDNDYIEKIAETIRSLFDKKEGTTLVVGLGNDEITPDALGIMTVQKILSTRHISEEIKRSANLTCLKSVACFCPSVTGKTGIETFESIKSIVDFVKPTNVIVIDALACKDIERLSCTIQISNTGISPGSGVQNKRKEISKKTLGCNVISIGIPTVVDALTLCNSCFSDDDFNRLNISSDKINLLKNMMVTPKEIDLILKRAAYLLSISLNKAIQTDVSVEDLIFLTN